MRSNFEGELHLSGDGGTVTVEGPIGLGAGAGATRITRMAAAVTQTSGQILVGSPFGPITARSMWPRRERLLKLPQVRCERGCSDALFAAGRRER